MFDETPNEPSKVPGYLPTVNHSDARYTTHFGKVATEYEEDYKEQVDTSQYRSVDSISYFVCITLFAPT